MLRLVLDKRFGQHLDFRVHGGLPDFGIKIKAEFQAIACWLARAYRAFFSSVLSLVEQD